MKSIFLLLLVPLVAFTGSVLAQVPPAVADLVEGNQDKRVWKQVVWDDYKTVIAQAESRGRSVPQKTAVTDANAESRKVPDSRAPIKEPAAAVVLQAAEEEEPDYYAGIHLGKHDVDEWRGRVNLGAGIELDGRVLLDSKREVGLLVGREYERSRYEVEYQLGRYKATDIEIGPTTATVTGKGKYQVLTLNAYRLKKLAEQWDAYAGLGIGWGRAELPAMGFAGSCQCFAAADKSGFVWLWRLGLDYQVNENEELYLQYSRVMNVPGPVSASSGPNVRYDDKDIGTLAVGWRLHH